MIELPASPPNTSAAGVTSTLLLRRPTSLGSGSKRKAYPLAKTGPLDSGGEPFLVLNFSSSSPVATVLVNTASADGVLKNMMAKYRESLQSLTEGDPRVPTGAVTVKLGEVLERCRSAEVLPHRIDVSNEGGAIVQFMKGPVYADIELLNSGEILAVVSVFGQPATVWSVEPDAEFGIAEALRSIEAALHGKSRS